MLHITAHVYGVTSLAMFKQYVYIHGKDHHGQCKTPKAEDKVHKTSFDLTCL